MVREILCRGYMNLDIEFLDGRPRLRAYLWELPGVAVTGGELPGRARSRTHDLSRANGSVILARGHGASALMSSRGRQIEYGGNGGSIMMPDWEWSSVESKEGFRPQTIGFSRDLLLAIMPDLEDRILATLPGEHPALQMLDAYVPLVCKSDVLDDPSKSMEAAKNLRDLVAVAFGTRRNLRQEALRRGYAAARSTVVIDRVRRRSLDPSFSLQGAAADLQLSERTLQQVFRDAGTTFSDFVLEQRLEHARHALTDPKQDDHSILSIALDAGFGDISYFNRRFRNHFGCTPSDFRAAERVARN